MERMAGQRSTRRSDRSAGWCDVTSGSGPRFTFTTTPLSGVVIVDRRPVEDRRGSLTRHFCAEEFARAGVLTRPVAQMNVTVTHRAGTVRGLHLQVPPAGETKVLSCMRGRLFEVAVDLRRGSPTYLEHVGVELMEEDGRSLVVPPGVANGVQALEDDSVLLYLTDAPHTPDREFGLHPQDPVAGVRWPLEVVGLSERDSSCPPFDPVAGVPAP